MKFSVSIAVLVTAVSIGGLECARALADVAPINSGPDPYQRVESFFKMPTGRTMGSSSSVSLDHAGNIWVVDRCGTNSCEGSTLDPIMEFDAKGNFIKAFGGGMLLFPHGVFIDRAGNIWVADGHAGGGKGDDVLEFDHDGKLLRTLGTPGVAGDGPDKFNPPSAVLVAPNGDIFVADGHEFGEGNARIVKFDKNGKYLKEWGGHGSAPGQFEVPHTLAMDSKGRLFVGDRGNSRVQIFDQDGKVLAVWPQFGRPSGLFVDQHDILYSTDSESRDKQAHGYHPGWKRGIRIGGANDGVVTAFIPDLTPDQENKSTSGAEGVTADSHGDVFAADVDPRGVVKYTKQ